MYLSKKLKIGKEVIKCQIVVIEEAKKTVKIEKGLQMLKIEEDQTTNEKTYITKGDNNNIEDSENIKFSAIIGKCILTIPYLGNIISVLENKLIVLIIIIISGTAFLIFNSKDNISKNTIATNLINEVESLRNNKAVNVADTNTRPVGFNWTCAATNLENPDYLVQPVTLINEIQALGDSIYEGDEYLDYHIRLTPETMNKVRAYNNKYDSYTEPSGQDAEEEGLILKADDTNKTAGITVYRSYLLHEVLNSNELLKAGLIGCNNEGKGENECNNTIDTSTACYNEYMAQSSVLKGAK